MTTSCSVMTPTKALSHFVSFEDVNGERQWKLNDEASMDLSKLIMTMHDEELPNNWRFDTIFDIFTALNTDEPIDTFQVADDMVDIYNHDLKKWMSTHTRDSYVDEAIEDGLVEMSEINLIVDLIRIGQFQCIHQMVIDAVAFFELETA